VTAPDGSEKRILELARIQKRLRRGMTAYGVGDFDFRSVFGCHPDESFLRPHVFVRVELNSVKERSGWYSFQVFVDFSLPVGATVEQAQRFDKAVRAAVKKARWARGVVDGWEWHREELT